MENLDSLKRKEEERKFKLEIIASEKESKQKRDLFSENHSKTIENLASMLKEGSIQTGENVELRIYTQKPEEYAFDRADIIRGVIEDVQYDKSTGENGLIILRRGKLFARKAKVPFFQLVGFEYQPEKRDTELKRIKEERKARKKEYQRKEARNDYLVGRGDGYYGSNVSLSIPEMCLLDFGKAEKIIKNMCGHRNKWKFEYARGRARMTGKGYGDLEVACASDEKDRIIGMIAMYETMHRGSTNFPSVKSDFRAGVNEVYPKFRSIAEIESPELREFIGKFYDGLYEISLKPRYYKD